MPVEHFTIRPVGTLWLGGEFEIEFDCNQAPKLASDGCRITKCKQLGFFVSHEYDIPAIYVTNSRSEKCNLPGCDNALMYRFEVSYRVTETIGFGFGFGGGTGTMGWTFGSREYREIRETDCICCDEAHRRFLEKPLARVVMPRPSDLSGVVTAVAVLTGLALSILNFDEPLAKTYVAGVSVLTLLAVYAAVVRHMAFWRRRYFKKDGSDKFERLR